MAIRGLARTSSGNGSVATTTKALETYAKDLRKLTGNLTPEQQLQEFWTNARNKSGVGTGESGHMARTKLAGKKLKKSLQQHPVNTEPQDYNGYTPSPFTSINETTDSGYFTDQLEGSRYLSRCSSLNSSAAQPELLGQEDDDALLSPYAYATPRTAQNYASLADATLFNPHDVFTPRHANALSEQGMLALYPYDAQAVLGMQDSQEPTYPEPLLPANSLIHHRSEDFMPHSNASSGSVGFGLGRSLSRSLSNGISGPYPDSRSFATAGSGMADFHHFDSTNLLRNQMSGLVIGSAYRSLQGAASGEMFANALGSLSHLNDTSQDYYR